MLWYAELVIEAALVLRLWLHRDGRRYFEALVTADFIVQIVQRIYDRLHVFGISVPVFYAGQVIAFPLLGLALGEAADYRPMAHRALLFWWTAANLMFAWVRVYPFTGTALLCCNSLFFAAWIGESIRRFQMSA